MSRRVGGIRPIRSLDRSIPVLAAAWMCGLLSLMLVWAHGEVRKEASALGYAILQKPAEEIATLLGDQFSRQRRRDVEVARHESVLLAIQNGAAGLELDLK